MYVIVTGLVGGIILGVLALVLSGRGAAAPEGEVVQPAAPSVLGWTALVYGTVATTTRRFVTTISVFGVSCQENEFMGFWILNFVFVFCPPEGSAAR